MALKVPRGVATPAEAIAGLRARVEADNLPPAIEAGLTDKLDGAVAALERGNGAAAVRMLTAFIKQVSAQRGKALGAEEADALTAQAQGIIGRIQP